MTRQSLRNKNIFPGIRFFGILILASLVQIFPGSFFMVEAFSAQNIKVKDECKIKRSRIKKEEELRSALRTVRQAIDEYKKLCEYGNVGPLDRKINDECYPPNLEVLVSGIIVPNSNRRIRILRRIPIDPMTRKREWGVRSMQDDPKSEKWGGENVFDIYSKSRKRALDRTLYRKW